MLLEKAAYLDGIAKASQKSDAFPTQEAEGYNL
jgi:hypothetical protein